MEKRAMDEKTRAMVAKSLIRLAEGLVEDVSVEEEDPNFVAKIRALKPLLGKLAQKKRRQLRQYGIGVIRSSDTVEDLVNALVAVVGG